jgi:hypothetical protein
MSAACDWALGVGKYVLFPQLCAAPWSSDHSDTCRRSALPAHSMLGRRSERTKLQSRFLRSTWVKKKMEYRFTIRRTCPRTMLQVTARGPDLERRT